MKNFLSTKRKYFAARLSRCLLVSIAAFSLPRSLIADTDSKTETRSPLEVVRAYTDAANRGDLEGFLALYSSDIKKFKFPDVKASEGLDHMREVYSRSFAAKKDLHIEIVSALTLGDKVVCRDHVTGLPGGKSADELTVYQVENGLITNIVYVERVEN